MVANESSPQRYTVPAGCLAVIASTAAHKAMEARHAERFGYVAVPVAVFEVLDDAHTVIVVGRFATDADDIEVARMVAALEEGDAIEATFGANGSGEKVTILPPGHVIVFPHGLDDMRDLPPWSEAQP